MMKEVARTGMVVALASTLVLSGTAALAPQTAQAAGTETVTRLLVAPPSGSKGLATKNFVGVDEFGRATISLVKSSKTSVVTAKKESSSGGSGVWLTPKKAGKGTVTFTSKKGGKTTKWTVKITVLKYTKPFKTFKIGKKNLTAKANEAVAKGTLKLKGTYSGKLKVKMRSGWKFERGDYGSGSKFGTLKNGKKITVKKGGWIALNMHRVAKVDGKKMNSGNIAAGIEVG